MQSIYSGMICKAYMYMWPDLDEDVTVYRPQVRMAPSTGYISLRPRQTPFQLSLFSHFQLSLFTHFQLLLFSHFQLLLFSHFQLSLFSLFQLSLFSHFQLSTKMRKKVGVFVRYKDQSFGFYLTMTKMTEAGVLVRFSRFESQMFPS